MSDGGCIAQMFGQGDIYETTPTFSLLIVLYK